MADTDTTSHSMSVPGEIARRSGRVAFSEDGRSTWEWQTATGVFSRNVSQEQLAVLSAADLEIIEAPPVNAIESWGSSTGRYAYAPARQSKTSTAYRPTQSALQRLLRKLTGAH